MKKVLSFVLALVLMLSVFPMVSITAQGETTGVINGATLNIGSSLTLDYYATFENALEEDVIMRFTSGTGKITDVQGAYDSNMEMYKFSYKGINPQCMADTIKAELICNDTVLATKDDYSVKAYCDNLVTRQDLGYTAQQLNAFKVLIADMLAYGSAAQEYKTYNTENLADASAWVKYFVSTFASPVGVREVEGNKDAENKVSSVGLNMANVNRIYFKFVASDGAIVKLNGETIDLSTLKKNGDAYMLYTQDIKATGFDDVYTLTIEKDGTVVSTVRYNVNAYIATMYNKGEADDLIKALYNYGASAEKFLKAKEAQENGGDFDLEDEDVLDTEVAILPENASTYETAFNIEDTGWSGFGDDPLKKTEIVEDDYGKCVHFVRNTTNTWNSPCFVLDSYIEQAGYYTITFNYKVEGATDGSSPFRVILRTATGTTFTNLSNGNYFNLLGDAKTAVNGQWETMTVNFSVEEADLKNTASKSWRFCMDSFTAGKVTDICIDNFVITCEAFDFTAQKNVINETETWVSNELVLISDKSYDDPFNDVTVDLILTKGTTSIRVPGFWDGGNIWRVRFACPEAGQWTYTTECNQQDAGLDGITNTLTCNVYSGELDIYKHGFIKTKSNTRYFMYADNTPFFYLGDTHWALGNETVDMVKTITKHRVNQGYTVYQSQPIGVPFTYHDGIGSRDVLLMKEFDEKFKIIADAGLVHANAQFFFASEINQLVYYFGGGYRGELCSTTITKGGTEYKFYDIPDKAKAYLEKICRYWVARYSSYPVMWTLGQEVDNDLYWMEDSGDTGWSYVNNPFRYVAEYLNMYDPYNSHLSAHQEVHSTTAASDSYPAVDGTNGAVDITTLDLRFNIIGGLTAGNSIIVETANNPEVANIKSGQSTGTGKTTVTAVENGVKFEITESFLSGIAYYYTNGCLTGDMAVYNSNSVDAKKKAITKTFVIHNPSSSAVTVEVAYYDGRTQVSKLAQTETIPAGESKTFTIRIDLGTISSAFRKVDAHTWYANQWKPNVDGKPSAGVTNAAKDYWYNGQGKPVVNYEADYCYLYTKNFGARAQGWFAYLSGMFGHGYGAQDTWCYLSDAYETREDSDGVDTITPAEKQAATWEHALEYESSYQLGYMKKFFEGNVEYNGKKVGVGDWHTLIPRFDDTAYLTRETKTYYGFSGGSDTGTAYAYIASTEDSSKVVVYFYNFSDKSLAQTPNARTGRAGLTYFDFGTLTGTLGNLEAGRTYNYMWFNPVTGKVDKTGTLTADANGKLIIPAKTTGDMVFYLYK